MSDVFIVGSPRSGTSWLRTLLAGHPELASPHELHLFGRYLAPLDAAWRREQLDLLTRRRAGRNDAVGLASALSDEAFRAWMRSLYERTRASVLAGKPGAHRLLEKTPGHALHMDLIRHTVPAARFLHLVRDPRDVVASMVERARRPFGEWAPRDVVRATASWRRHVEAALRDARPEDTLLVRYESLRADPHGVLEEIARFLALEGDVEGWLVGDPGTPAFVRADAVTVRIGAVASGKGQPEPGDPGDPDDQGDPDERDERCSGKVRDEGLAAEIGAPTRTGLAPVDRWYVEAECAELMSALGYPPCERSGEPPRIVRTCVGRVVVRGLRRARRAAPRPPWARSPEPLPQSDRSRRDSET